MIQAQTQQILTHLQKGADITPIEALELFGSFRLGARIYDLKQDGHQIDSEMIVTADGKRFKKYWLAK